MRALLLAACFAALVAPQTVSSARAQDTVTPDRGVIPEPDAAPQAVPDEAPMAEPTEPAPPPSPVEKALPRDLDGLFAELRRERDRKRAGRLERAIWREWARYDDETVNLLSGWATRAMSRKKYGVALDLLDRVVVMAPDYAEGWNRRATLHFMRRDYVKSLADIERTLQIEPRHFGALAGMGTILMQLGRKPEALEVWYRALSVNPSMTSAQKAVEKLEEELAGRGI